MLKVKTVAETLEAGEQYERLSFDELLVGGCLFACVLGALVVAPPSPDPSTSAFLHVSFFWDFAFSALLRPPSVFFYLT